MTDPLAFMLWQLLGMQSSVTAEDLCFWDSIRAERVLILAGMVKNAGDYWLPSDDTIAWYERTWDELRKARPTHLPPTGDPEAGLPEEAPPAFAEPALSKAGCAVRHSTTQAHR
jgi:hypothetical protein